MCLCNPTGEVFDYLVSHGRMKEVEARAKFRQVEKKPHLLTTKVYLCLLLTPLALTLFVFLALTDCLCRPLLPHKEHCPQRFEGENSQRVLGTSLEMVN